MAYPFRAAASRAWQARPVVARVLPFLVYVIFLGLQSTIDQGRALVFPDASSIDLRWLYALRVAATATIMAHFWGDYTELAFGGRRQARETVIADHVAATLAGVLVFVLWINLDQGWAVLGSPGPGFVAIGRDGLPDWPLIAARIAGAAIVVPVMEELFWRSFIQRWIDKPAFLDVDPRQTSHRAVVIASLFFGFEHSQWLAGVLAGLGYGYLYRYTGRLWVAVVAHGVTNFMLGCWVVATRQWHFW